jgi:hypothetical protein
VFEKDDRSMLLIEKRDRLLYHLETIDIENDEYLFWDSTGAGTRVSVARDAIDQITRCDQSMSLSDAFEAYVQSLGLGVSLERTSHRSLETNSIANLQTKAPLETPVGR